MVNDIAVQDFVNAIKEPPTENNTTYSATVSKIDNEGVVWVNIYGSDKETPTASTSSEVKKGDNVTVNWRNNKLYIAGNYSNPSAGVTTVNRVEGVANNAQSTANIAYVAATNAVEDAERAASAATSAESSASQAAISASNAETSAGQAATAASNAQASAGTAATAATNAESSASTAATAATNAQTSAGQAAASAQQAATDAASAKASAYNANEYATRALGNLSTVQSVAETLTWVTQHGTMAKTTDTDLDPTHVYFVRDNNGDYVVGSYHYSLVIEPQKSALSTYYELTIDESLNNYVGTHLALTNEGLWLLPATSGTHKVLIATGAGSTYTTAGTYIIDSTGGTVASFRADGATIGENISGKSRAEIAANGMQIYRNDGTNTLIANIGFGSAINEQGAPVNAPYYTFGERRLNGSAEYPVGAYSFVAGSGVATNASATSLNDSFALGVDSLSEGSSTVASGQGAHAEGRTNHTYASGGFITSGGITASGDGSHAEGYSVSSSGQGTWDITASGNGAHAEGYASERYGNITAAGKGSHAQNAGTQALSDFQTAIGRCNVEDGNDTYAFIIGNGTDEDNRSNALTVAWNGDVDTAGDISIASGKHFKINGTNLAASDIGAVPTTRTVNSKALSSDITLTASDVSAVPTTRTVNNKALSSDITLSASDVGAVPTTRTVNGNALSSNITLSASDVGAVPTTRTVNGKALSSDISLTASDVGLEVTTPSVSVSATTGTLSGAYVRQYGKLVQISLTFQNSSSVASGSNVFTGTLDTEGLRPLVVTSGGSYYGAHAIMGFLNQAGAITIRNASSTAVTISGTNTATVSFTYIVA